MGHRVSGTSGQRRTGQRRTLKFNVFQLEVLLFSAKEQTQKDQTSNVMPLGFGQLEILKMKMLQSQLSPWVVCFSMFLQGFCATIANLSLGVRASSCSVLILLHLLSQGETGLRAHQTIGSREIVHPSTERVQEDTMNDLFAFFQCALYYFDIRCQMLHLSNISCDANVWTNVEWFLMFIV